MSTIQSLKNFIRHGKQARLVTPHAEPTTDVSPVHAQHQRQSHYPPAAGNLDAIDSKRGNGHPQAQQDTDAQRKRSRDLEIEKIVEEEKQSRAKMPKYPGLERWILLDKMGDGAFSNVYRAKDSTGQYDEVAIKVVRKFEMNSNQVGTRNMPLPPLHPTRLDRETTADSAHCLRHLANLNSAQTS